MSFLRTSDVSKHLARKPKRAGIVLPFPALRASIGDNPMDGLSERTEEVLPTDDSQSIAEAEHLHAVPEGQAGL